MARPNAVVSSPYRKEIEEMLREGKPDTYISNWLKERDAYISNHTIGNYKNNHFNISLEAQKKYNEQQSRQRLDEGSDDVVDDVVDIDKSNKLILQHLDYAAMTQRELIQMWNNNLDKKYKILGVIKGAETTVNVNGASSEDELLDLFKKEIKEKRSENVGSK